MERVIVTNIGQEVADETVLAFFNFAGTPRAVGDERGPAQLETLHVKSMVWLIFFVLSGKQWK